MGKRIPTAETTEGPYYKEGSPERTELAQEGVPGENLHLTGYVLDSDGRPLAGAWLDFWQADGSGHYDNAGYTLRGHQFSSESGQYRLNTVVPGSYPGRTPHIHVKVRSDDKRATLTTQLFFPGLATNATDSIFRDDLLIGIGETPRGKSGKFDFVLDLS
jgi:protocatechuate 3,4-dioxygenase beta subunit